MPRLCAPLGFLFGEMPFLDRFDAAARAGFVGVEYASPYDYPAAELRTRLKAAGLTQVLINSPAGNRAAGERGMACIPERAAVFRDSIHQALDYAAALDCKLVHVMGGAPPREVAYDAAAALYAANLAWAAEQALSDGIKLVIEPLNPRDAPGYILRTQEQGAAIVAAIGRDRLGLRKVRLGQPSLAKGGDRDGAPDLLWRRVELIFERDFGFLTRVARHVAH